MMTQKLGLFCICLTAILCTRAVQGSVQGCDAHFYDASLTLTHKGRCYYFIDTERKYYQAEEHCRNVGTSMVTIESGELQRVINGGMRKVMSSSNGVWLGLTMSGSDFWWSTGAHLGGYTNWGKGHPKYGILNGFRGCNIMKREDGYRWHQKICLTVMFNEYRSICQGKLTATTTTSTTTTTTAATTTTTTMASTTNAEAMLLYHKLGVPLPGNHLEAARISSLESSESSKSHYMPMMIVIGICLLLFMITALIYWNRRLVQKLHHNEDRNCYVAPPNKIYIPSIKGEGKDKVLLPSKLLPEAVPLRAGERVENVYVSDAQIRKLPDLPTYEEIIKDDEETAYNENIYSSVQDVRANLKEEDLV